MPIEKQLEALIKLVEQDIEGFSLERKEDSRLMKILARVLFFTNFMRFTTTIQPKVYVAAHKWENPLGLFRTLAHEWVHLRHGQEQNTIWYSFKYLFPQILAILSLFSLLAIWFSSWWLLSLVFLVCAAPLPAPFRAREEMDAYTMTMFVYYTRHGFVSEALIDHISKHFTGANYYFMRPGKSRVQRELLAIVDQVQSSHFDDKPGFKEVKQIIEA